MGPTSRLPYGGQNNPPRRRAPTPSCASDPLRDSGVGTFSLEQEAYAYAPF